MQFVMMILSFIEMLLRDGRYVRRGRLALGFRRGNLRNALIYTRLSQ